MINMDKNSTMARRVAHGLDSNTGINNKEFTRRIPTSNSERRKDLRNRVLSYILGGALIGGAALGLHNKSLDSSEQRKAREVYGQIVNDHDRDLHTTQYKEMIESEDFEKSQPYIRLLIYSMFRLDTEAEHYTKNLDYFRRSMIERYSEKLKYKEWIDNAVRLNDRITDLEFLGASPKTIVDLSLILINSYPRLSEDQRGGEIISLAIDNIRKAISDSRLTVREKFELQLKMVQHSIKAFTDNADYYGYNNLIRSSSYDLHQRIIGEEINKALDIVIASNDPRLAKELEPKIIQIISYLVGKDKYVNPNDYVSRYLYRKAPFIKADVDIEKLKKVISPNKIELVRSYIN